MSNHLFSRSWPCVRTEFRVRRLKNPRQHELPRSARAVHTASGSRSSSVARNLFVCAAQHFGSPLPLAPASGCVQLCECESCDCVSSERAGEDMIWYGMVWPASKNKAAFASCSLGLLCDCLFAFAFAFWGVISCSFTVRLFSFLLSLGVPTRSLNTLCCSAP